MSLNYSYRISPSGERYIPALNRTCFERTSSAQYYDNYLDIKLAARDTLTIVIGSDSGLLYRYLLAKDIPEGSRIVLIEPDDIFENVQAECQHWQSPQPHEHSASQVTLCRETDWRAQVFDGTDAMWFLAGDVQLAQAQCAIADYQNLYYTLYRETREAISERSYHTKTTFAVKTFTAAQMVNCIDAHTAMRIDCSFGKGRVAVVLGGG